MADSPSSRKKRRATFFGADNDDLDWEKAGDDDLVTHDSSARLTRTRSAVASVLSGADRGGAALRRFVQSRRRRGAAAEEEDSDSEGDEPWDPRKNKKRVSMLSTEELLAIETQVKEDLNLPDPGEPWPWRLRLQLITGILWCRTKIRKKQLRVERELPAYPAILSIVQPLKFESFIGLVILANMVNIGVDSMYAAGDDKPMLVPVLESIFTGLFVIEWFMRILAHSWVWVFAARMNFFDTIVVWVTGVLVTWVFAPIGLEVNLIRRLNALRVLRLGRIIRAIRIIPEFRELWTLVEGVLGCFNLLLWAGIIIGVVIYIFAVFALETIAKSDTFKEDALIQEHFGDLSNAMFTLFQIMTFDSWNVVVRRIAEQMPVAIIFFMLYMGVSGIVLFNLMTAIVVMNSIVDAPKRDEEAVARKKDIDSSKMQVRLRKMFEDIDADGSGKLSAEEFEDVLEDVNFVRTMKILDIDLEELPDIFDILDDGTGEISTESFITGLMRMQGPAMARDMLKSTRRMSTCSENFTKMEEVLFQGSVEPLERMENDLDVMHEDFIKMQTVIAKNLDHLNTIGVRRIVRATVPEVPPATEPTLKEAHKKEKAADRARRANAERGIGANAERSTGAIPRAASPTKAAPLGQPPGSPLVQDKGLFLKPLPASWIIRRREEEGKRRKAAEQEKMAQARKAHRAKAALLGKQEEEPHPIPGVHQEFGPVWRECALDVPDVSLGDGRARSHALAPKWVPPGEAKAPPSHRLGPVQLPSNLAVPSPKMGLRPPSPRPDSPEEGAPEGGPGGQAASGEGPREAATAAEGPAERSPPESGALLNGLPLHPAQRAAGANGADAVAEAIAAAQPQHPHVPVAGPPT